MVSYALKDEVEKELDKLEKNGVIVKTDRSDRASPIVVVPKADKSVRICGDYKSKFFSKLDLSHAYAQLSVDKVSREYLTISTHKGLYSYTKLPNGAKSAPKIFQAKMDMILQGVEKCVCILIGGVSRQENIKILAEVLERLQK